MGAVVIADFRIGGKNGLSRNDLKKIIQVLGISDPQARLPIGSAARYILLLETTAPTPTQVPVPPPTQVSASKPKKRKKKKL
jgi:hypothetical protein